jgi:hypothetical protein
LYVSLDTVIYMYALFAIALTLCIQISAAASRRILSAGVLFKLRRRRARPRL